MMQLELRAGKPDVMPKMPEIRWCILANQLNYEPVHGDIILIDVSEGLLLDEYAVKWGGTAAGKTVSLGYENS